MHIQRPTLSVLPQHRVYESIKLYILNFYSSSMQHQIELLITFQGKQKRFMEEREDNSNECIDKLL